MTETGNFNSADGTNLFFRASTPKPKSPLVVVVHGFAEHSGRYTEILAALDKIGYCGFSFDFRGHGQSHGRRGYIQSFQDYVDDLNAAVSFACNKYQNESAILLAHSMGGLVAAYFACQAPAKVDGLVISSPLFGIRIEVPGWKKNLGRIMSRYWPSFSLPNEINANELTHDEQKAAAYAEDPLIFHHVTARWFEEIQSATKNVFDIADKFSHPFFLQLSADDRVVSLDKSREWFDRNQSPDKEARIYPAFFHEIYNESNRKIPISDFSEWMLARWKPNECDLKETRTASDVAELS